MSNWQANYQKRYAANWQAIASEAKHLIKGRCCYPGCKAKSESVHHAVYCDRKGAAIAGKEKPGIHIFPLCDLHHREAHWPRNWIVDSKYPELKNRNTSFFYRQLRNGWLKKVRH